MLRPSSCSSSSDSPDAESIVTGQTIRTVVAEAETAGAVEFGEHAMIASVLRLDDRMVRGVMTPGVNVDWLDLASDTAIQRAHLIDSPLDLMRLTALHPFGPGQNSILWLHERQETPIVRSRLGI